MHPMVVPECTASSSFSSSGPAATPSPVSVTAVWEAIRRVREAATRAAATLSPDELIAEGCRILQEHRVEFCQLGQETEETNNVVVRRDDLVGDCIATTMSEDFIDGIFRPLRVTFVDEEGVDGGALRNDVFGSLAIHFKPFFESGYILDDSDEPIHYAAGVWLGN